ncbi:MAG: metalloregulator ArsR/SmtB family transcription factor [Bacteroidetes bacterium]|nr:metalloregulator ArsR/SmtB family transcription factor [Bacteroidota bacterium]
MSKATPTFSIELFFRALADRTRLRLLNLMSDGEICVCFFTEILDESQPKVSRHLAYLRRAGIVASRREGKWMHYRMQEPAEERARALLRATVDSLRNDPAMQRDRQKLSRLCCSPRLPASLNGAPVPVLNGSVRTTC